MKKIIILSLLFAGMSACATAPQGFGPAYGSDFGYRNTLRVKNIRVAFITGG